eukprot:TRINITY_DN10646_c0_g1_i2.p3 TRINITY_DN10646_c0_g1~~TRINITY_DN10646_c0_g1_i2.p3  ORF type:complete len:161 (-),score=14.29 TRINITY_DN10646_c0_g1_i2:39-521(-)
MAYTDQLQSCGDIQSQLLANTIAQLCHGLEKKLSSLVGNYKQKQSQPANKYLIKEILDKLCYSQVCFLDPLGSKKIYERYSNNLEEEIWNINQKHPAVFIRGNLDLPVVTKATSKKYSMLFKEIYFQEAQKLRSIFAWCGESECSRIQFKVFKNEIWHSK